MWRWWRRDGGGRSYDQGPGTYGQPTAQRTLITAQMFGVRGTPFVIAPDGRIHQGRPDDLIGWLAGTQTGAPKAGEGGQ